MGEGPFPPYLPKRRGSSDCPGRYSTPLAPQWDPRDGDHFLMAGMGRLFIDALAVKEYPILMGMVMVKVFPVILGSLLADVAIALIELRIRLQ